MKLIQLRGKYAISEREFAKVDDDDFEYLSQFKWYVAKSRRNFYVHRGVKNEKTNNMGKIVMHRVIMKINKKEISIDHKDHNGLNNQKSNLRICDNFQNAKNKTSKINATSKYLGVYCNKKISKWTAQVSVGGYKNRKLYFLGNFPLTEEGEIQAAKAYDEAAKIHHKEFANLNFK